jgi:hypothetical protein
MGIGEARRQPSIAIHGTDEPLDVHDVRFELTHEQGARPFVVPEDVDSSALTVDRERGLGFQRPLGCGEGPGHGVVHGGVPGIDHSVQLTASPSREPVDPDLQGGSDPQQRFHSQQLQLAAFDPRHGWPRHSGARRDIALSPALAQADGADRGAQPKCVHPFIVPEGSLLGA